MSAESSVLLSRNRQQACNAVQYKKPRDLLFKLILKNQSLNTNVNYIIRQVKLSTEPSVVLAMDYRVAMYTDPAHHCVYGIDPTFDL